MGELREPRVCPFGSEAVGSVSISRLRRIAFFRFPSLWFNCLALPETRSVSVSDVQRYASLLETHVDQLAAQSGSNSSRGSESHQAPFPHPPLWAEVVSASAAYH